MTSGELCVELNAMIRHVAEQMSRGELEDAFYFTYTADGSMPSIADVQELIRDFRQQYEDYLR